MLQLKPDSPQKRLRIGLIVNPIAGMGGFVGLKGTDGPDAVAEARRIGARPTASGRMKRTLMILKSCNADCEFVAPDGEMGGNILRELGIRHDSFPLMGELSARATQIGGGRMPQAERRSSSCSAEATALRGTWRKSSA